MSRNTEQIERHFHPRKKHGGYDKCRGYTRQLKKAKKRIERRNGKEFVIDTTVEFDGEGFNVSSETVPKNSPSYKKFAGWEY